MSLLTIFDEASRYDPAAEALFSAMAVKPSGARKRLYNALIAGLKADGLWPKIDVLYVFAAHAAADSRINIKNPGTYNAATAGATANHVTDRGYTFASTGHLTTGFVPSTAVGAGSAWQQNSAHIYGYVNLTTAETSNLMPIVGVLSTAGTGNWLHHKDSSGRIAGRLNSATTSTGTGTDLVTTRMGGSMLTRTGATALSHYRDGLPIVTDNDASSATIDTQELWVGRYINNYNTLDRLGAVSIGGGLTDAEALALHNRIEAFLTAIGAQRFDVAAIPLFAAMSTDPGDTRKRLYDDLIRGLKADGVWSKLDALYMFAAHEAATARLNIRNPGTYNITEVDSPTLVPDLGYTASGSAHLDTGFNPTTAVSPNYTQDSAHVGAYVNSVVDPAGSAAALIGLDTTGGVITFLRPRTATGFLDCRLNSSDGVAFFGATTRLGHSMVSRTGATTSKGYKGGSPIGSTSVGASSTMQSKNILFLRSGTTYNANDRIAAGHLGAGLNDAEAAAVAGRIGAFLAGIGAA